MPATGLPKTSTSPSLGGSRPEMRARVVDLPHPVGPTTAQNSPGSTRMSRSRSAVKTVPEGVRNRLVTPRSSMAEATPRLSTPTRRNSRHAVVVAVLVVLVAGRRVPSVLRSGDQTLKTRLPLAYQILGFQVAIILLSALIGAAAAVWQASQELDRQSEQRSLAIAESVANDASIQEALLGGDPGGIIQQAAEDVRRSTGARYVVVTDAQGIRYSHPNPAMIGKPVDEDPSAVLAGHTWVGVQKGTLGVSARGKAPIFNQGHVIGLVSVGYLEVTVGQLLLVDLPC